MDSVRGQELAAGEASLAHSLQNFLSFMGLGSGSILSESKKRIANAVHPPESVGRVFV
jgi:hypothetical protein